MENPLCTLTAEDAELLELGGALGEHNAFALVAGRCSAAQARRLRKLREFKSTSAWSPAGASFAPAISR